MSQEWRLGYPLVDIAHPDGCAERVASRPYAPPVERHGL